MPMPLAIACPHCRKLTKVDPTWAGHTVACPHCKEQFKIPTEVNPPSIDLAEDSSPSLVPPRPEPNRRRTFLILTGILVVLLAGAIPWLVWYLGQGQARDPVASEEEQAKAQLEKALKAWHHRDGQARIAQQHNLDIADPDFARGSVLLDYQISSGRLIKVHMPGVPPGQIVCQIAVKLTRQTKDRNEIKENKQYVVYKDDTGQLGASQG
jgi:phage FluMu protein Com